MSNSTDMVCPCCGGDGTDKWFDLPKCVACHGLGYIMTSPLGSTNEMHIRQHKVSMQNIRQDPQLAKDLFDFFRETRKDKNWWEVHAELPMLEKMEKLLLSEGLINLSDIPGGPNNPTHPKMVARAKEIEQAMLKVAAELRAQAGEDMSNPAYNSYANRSKSDLRNQIKEKAAKAAADINATADTSASQPTSTTEDTKMSERNVVGRLKDSGRTVVNAAKEGALLGTVTAANKGAVEFLEFKLGDKYPDILKTEAGRTAIQMAIPAIMLMVCEMDEGNKIPMKDHVRQAAELAVKGVSADAMESAMTFLLQNGMFLLQAYANAGAEIEASHQVTETFDAEAELARVTEIENAREVVPSFER